MKTITKIAQNTSKGLLLAAVAFGFTFMPFASAFTPTVQAANSTSTYDIDVVANPSTGNTEYVEVTNNTGDDFDMSNIEVHEEGADVFYAYSNVLDDGDSFRICADETQDSANCDSEWTGGDILNDGGGDTVSFRFQSASSTVLGSVSIPNSAVEDEVYEGTFSITHAGSVINDDTGEVFSTIQGAIDDSDTDAGDTIRLDQNITTSKQVTIDKGIILDGDGYTIDAAFTKTDNSNNSAIGVQSNDVTIKDLTVDGANGAELHGINVYESTGVVIDTVTVMNFRSGIGVNSSEVTARDITTSGNIWHGINVDKRTSMPASLTIEDTSAHSENSPIPPSNFQDGTHVAHIFVDDATEGTVINDVDNQYDTTEVDFRNGRADVYTLKSDELAEPVDPYSNGFEENTDDWSDYGGTITREESGTDNIPSQCGDHHAVIDGSVFSRWGGYANEFPVNGYTTEIDVYLDMAEADGSDKRFDFSSAINDTNGDHRRDFIFHAGTKPGESGTFVVNTSNNAPGNPSAAGSAKISETGWYTLQAYFHENGSGELEVTMNVIRRADNSVIFSKGLSDSSDVIGSTVGGNRYGWFTSQQFDFEGLAIDNASLYLGEPQERGCESADSEAPQTTFTSPDNGAVVTGTRVTGKIADNENVAQYSFIISGPESWNTRKWRPETATTSFDVNLCEEDKLNECDEEDLPDGEYKVRVAAYDGNGNRDISSNVAFVLDTNKPQVNIDDPEWGDTVGSDFLVTGTATDTASTITEVKYTITEIEAIGCSNCYVDTIDNGIATGTENWSFEGRGLESGFYRLKVQAFDEAGNWKYDHHDVEVDAEKPSIIFTSPENGSTVADTRVTGEITDNRNVAQYSFIVSGPEGNNWNTRKWKPNTPTTSFDVNLCDEDRLDKCDEEDLPEGEYKVRAAVYDGNGGRDISTSITFNLNTVDPSLTITDPDEDGETITPGEYTFKAEYIDDDQGEDPIHWAIRSGTCEANTEDIVTGNVAGHSAPSSFDGTNFSTTVDMSNWDEGEYCLAVNPQEGGDGPSFREARSFILDDGAGSISGQKFEDDEDFGDVAGWNINLYQLETESAPEEPIASTTTDEEGDYSFEDVPYGNYLVCEVMKEGWDQQWPDPDFEYDSEETYPNSYGDLPNQTVECPNEETVGYWVSVNPENEHVNEKNFINEQDEKEVQQNQTFGGGGGTTMAASSFNSSSDGGDENGAGDENAGEGDDEGIVLGAQDSIDDMSNAELQSLLQELIEQVNTLAASFAEMSPQERAEAQDRMNQALDLITEILILLQGQLGS